MNAALRRISGEGDSEKGWKRLFGSSRTFPERLDEEFSAGPGELFSPGPSMLASWLRASKEAIVHRCWLVIVVALCNLGRVFVDFSRRFGNW